MITVRFRGVLRTYPLLAGILVLLDLLNPVSVPLLLLVVGGMVLRLGHLGEWKGM